MEDLNKNIKAVFNIVRDEDGELVARSESYEDIDFHLEEPTAMVLQNAIGFSFQGLYPMMFDCPSPERILISENTDTPADVIAQFTATISAPKSTTP